jgi:hypothetical protein
VSRRNISILIIFLLAGIITRLWFIQETNLTYEDALISFRYAENLSEGGGFAYNTGEKVLGTTSPLWTFLLAILRVAGSYNTIDNARFLSLLFDTLTVIILMTTFCSLKHPCFASIWAILFVSSSGIVPITVSGMETSLLIFSMALAIRGLALKTSLLAIGAAVTVLTRMDGLLFAIPILAASLITDRRWGLRQVAMTVSLLLPWLLFSTIYFGDPIPQSLKAKMGVYDLGFTSSAKPFIDRFTPIGEVTLIKSLFKTVSSVVILAGLAAVRKRTHPLLPVAGYFIIYSVLFMSSGGLIFPWYLTPAIFAYDLILATGFAMLLGKVESRIGKKVADIATCFVIIAIVTLNISILSGRRDEYREIQEIEDELRTEIGLWLRDNLGSGESVFLEPIGYIGYHAGPGVRIIDEIGIVSPQIERIRSETTAWYIKALRESRPDYIVEYTRSLEENVAEGAPSPLFTNQGDHEWFYDNYSVVKTFGAKGHYPHIAEKEKRYTILKRKDREPVD